LAHADLDRELKHTRYLSPEELVAWAVRRGAAGISWTFNEPALWLEYILDTAPLARQAGLFTNIVTNGALTLEAVDALGPHLDVYRVDIKGDHPRTYEILAHLQEPEAIRQAAVRARRGWGMWVEVVTNIIPGINDDKATLKGIAAWLTHDLSRNTPWHLTRFHPAYHLQDLPSTPVNRLETAYKLARAAGVSFPYLGNVPGHAWENTFCLGCGREVISRDIFTVTAMRLTGGMCQFCRTPVPGVWR
jgi:pyruvate formate lyase activating enzyme